MSKTELDSAPERIWFDCRTGRTYAVNETETIEYIRSDLATASPPAHEIHEGVAPLVASLVRSENERQPTSLLPASEMIDRELVDLAMESHARAIMYPESKVQHDRANECRGELLKRLAASRVTAEATDLVAGEAMTIEENLRMIESWLRPLRPGEEPFMRERAIAIHVRFIREALVPLESIVEAAKAFIWEPENWESYQDSKASNSVAWPPEFLLLAQTVEQYYGALPLDEPCHLCGAKTVATHAPDCSERPGYDLTLDERTKNANEGPASEPKCVCFAPPTEQHSSYCPREGMDFDPESDSPGSSSTEVDWEKEAGKVVMESADSVAVRTNGTWINTRSETLIADVTALCVRAYKLGLDKKLGAPKP